MSHDHSFKTVKRMTSTCMKAPYLHNLNQLVNQVGCLPPPSLAIDHNKNTYTLHMYLYTIRWVAYPLPLCSTSPLSVQHHHFLQVQGNLPPGGHMSFLYQNDCHLRRGSFLSLLPELSTSTSMRQLPTLPGINRWLSFHNLCLVDDSEGY